ncbi:RND transporter [Sulfurifustis variabilis]|uniref:RND transporter n=1 Tax=Sulfurifustis variabilis TaxID=1675686 RepID=A0A1B4V700_9GAMM|nr:hypothetical protein [Sulfurifustis variabilis]BAU49319.1 RND transporter [Sulfurifustis variabilis]
MAPPRELLAWLDSVPLIPLAIGALFLGLAPFTPEPHVWQKIKMLAAGQLSRPLDIFDLLMHAALPVLLVLKLARRGRAASHPTH